LLSYTLFCLLVLLLLPLLLLLLVHKHMGLAAVAVLLLHESNSVVLASKHSLHLNLLCLQYLNAPCGIHGLSHAVVADNTPHVHMPAITLLLFFTAACTANPPDIPNGSWDCGSTAIRDSCTATCSPGFDYAPAPNATCTVVAWSPVNNTATAWSPVNGTCQPLPITPTIPNSDIVYQTARLPLGLSISGNCSKQAADALGNGLVNDLQQLLANAKVNDTFVTVLKASCSSTNKRRSVSDQQLQQQQQQQGLAQAYGVHHDMQHPQQTHA
jgi:hypothetical protein